MQRCKNYLTQFNSLIGWKNIINFHINDSRWTLGSRKDEHRGLGEGLIYKDKAGCESLKYLVKFCKKRKIPMILETHSAGSPNSQDSSSYSHEISYLKKLSN